MGRNIPPNDITTTTTIHPLLSLAISVAWIAAMVATISSLCGIWSKKTSKTSKKGDKKNTENITPNLTVEMASTSPSPIGNNTHTNSTENKATTTTTNDGDDDITTKPLPPPPSAAKLEFGESTMVGNKSKKKIDKSSSLKNYVSKGSTRRRLSSSISMKMSMKIKDKASDFKGKASDFKDKASEFKGKASDFKDRKARKNDSESLWNKRIILGEKCRRPNDYDDDEVKISRNNNNNEEEEEEEKEQEQGGDISDDNGDNNDDDVASSERSHSRTTSRSLSHSNLSIDDLSISDDETSRIDRKGKKRFSSDEEDDI